MVNLGKFFGKLKPHHHINFLLIITILLIIFLLILIKPAMLGYKISQQFKEMGTSASDFIRSADSLKSKLLITENNLEMCKNLNKDYINSLSKKENETFKCQQEKSELVSKINQLKSEQNFNISRIQSDFEQRKSEVEHELAQEKAKTDELNRQYDTIVENSANNICCKAKVDIREIDSYFISNEKIVCTSGEKNKISC